jgi:hypothetical protein
MDQMGHLGLINLGQIISILQERPTDPIQDIINYMLFRSIKIQLCMKT